MEKIIKREELLRIKEHMPKLYRYVALMREIVDNYEEKGDKEDKFTYYRDSIYYMLADCMNILSITREELAKYTPLRLKRAIRFRYNVILVNIRDVILASDTSVYDALDLNDEGLRRVAKIQNQLKVYVTKLAKRWMREVSDLLVDYSILTDLAKLKKEGYNPPHGKRENGDK